VTPLPYVCYRFISPMCVTGLSPPCVLHVYVYYRFMVERLFLQCIVPFALNSADRMKRLLSMFAYIDDNSRKAFSTMLKAQTQSVTTASTS